MEPTSKEAIYLAALKREAFERAERIATGDDRDVLAVVVYVGGLCFRVTVAGSDRGVVDGLQTLNPRLQRLLLLRLSLEDEIR